MHDAIGGGAAGVEFVAQPAYFAIVTMRRGLMEF